MTASAKAEEEPGMVISDHVIEEVKTMVLNKPMDVIHNTVDIIFVMEGQILAFLPFLPELTLFPNDFMIISPEYTYLLEPGTKESQFIRMTLNSRDVENFLGNTISVRCNSALAPNKNYDYMRMLVRGIVNLWLSDAWENRLEILSLYFGLLSEIKKNFSVSVEPDPDTSVKYRERMRKIVNFIEQNFSYEITLPMLARKLFLTPQYLSRFFKDNFHKSFTAYLNEIRLKHAESDLIETNYDVTKIALNNGFGSPASFNRAFKKYYGMAPGAWRKQQNLQKKKSSPGDINSAGELSVHGAIFDMVPSPDMRRSLSDLPFSKK